MPPAGVIEVGRDREKRRGSRRDFGWRDRNASGEGPSNAKNAFVAIVLIALIGGGIWLYYTAQRSQFDVDEVTLCPKDRPATQIAVVLLDVSDKLTSLQSIAVKNDLKRIQAELPKFGRIEVYALADAVLAQPVSVIQMCNPGSGEDLNRLYQNPELARIKWTVKFMEHLSSEIDKVLGSDPDEQSPIFEGIQSISIRTFGRPEFDQVEKRLFIFSDLLQNVSGSANHYQSIPDFEDFRDSNYYRRVRADLGETRISLFYIDRASVATQGVKHIQFWNQFLLSQGGTEINVTRLFGDK
jgi:hypothetical protein